MRVFHLIFRSPISVLAAASVVFFLGAIVWQIQSHFNAGIEPSYVAASNAPQPTVEGGADYQQEMLLLGLATTSDPSATSENDPLEMIGPVIVAQLVGEYAGLVDSGTYSPERAAAAAEGIASNVRAAISYKTYTASDLKSDSDISYQRMLTYRSNMRDALEPLLDNSRSEFEIYGDYIDTRNEIYLDELKTVADRYKLAAKNASSVVVPRDALTYQKNILNAMEQFAATLDAMSTHADDALASVALLRSYNSAEQNTFTSFDALGRYYAQKRP